MVRRYPRNVPATMLARIPGWSVILATTLAGCGRIGFEPPGDGGLRDVLFDARPPLGAATAIAIGSGGVCAVLEDRSLWCWGDLRQGTLPVGSLGSARAVGFALPSQIGTDTDWSEVALGEHHGCALKVDGSLWCWGDNDRGQVGITATGLVEIPTRLAAGGWAHVAAHRSTSCAISSSGTLSCWGSNDDAQFGNNSTISASQPTENGTLAGVRRIVLGASHACALTGVDELWCWGGNTDGQLGNNVTGAPSLVPLRVPGQWRDVSAGFYATTAIASDGTLWAWGHGLSNVRVQLDPRTTWSRTTAAYAGVCGILTGGELWCRGVNPSGDLGMGSNTQLDDLTHVAVGQTFASIVHDTSWNGFGHQDVTCGTRTDGLVCAGIGSRGQLGDGDTSRWSRAPRKVPGGPWLDIEVASTFSCARESGGIASCWGHDPTNAVNASALPRAVSLRRFDRVSIGDLTCGLEDSGAVWTWGLIPTSNVGGVFASPASFDAGPATAVACGSGRGAMVRADATLWAWGDNGVGQLGDGTTTFRATPVQIATTTSAVDIGYGHACSISTGGALSCWGQNAQGQLGDGTTTDRSSPTPVAKAGPWLAVSASIDSGAHTCAIHNDRTLWCWGWNFAGQLGSVPINTNAVAPRQVSLETWQTVDTARATTCAIRDDATLWCWGSNVLGARDGTYGVDGGDGPDESLPVQVGSDADWTAISLAADHACARKTSGDVWCWGTNDTAQLGTQPWTPTFVPVVR